jgi:hypothetical protein
LYANSAASKAASTLTQIATPVRCIGKSTNPCAYTATNPTPQPERIAEKELAAAIAVSSNKNGVPPSAAHSAQSLWA